MKPMTRLLSVWALSVVATHVTIAAVDENELRRVQQMDAVVSRDGITGLLSLVTTNHYRSPRIYSRWYIDRLTNKEPDVVRLEEAKHRFGLAFAKGLEDEAKRVRSLTDDRERERAIGTLLDLEEWITSSTGYGNEFLGWRCFNIATVPLAHLVVDLEYPLVNVRRLLQRFPPREAKFQRISAVLNSEAGRTVFQQPRGSHSEAFRQLDQQWVHGVQALNRWREAHHPEYHIAQMSRWRKFAPDNLAFYADDDLPNASTLVSRWSLKLHHLLLTLDDRNPEFLRDLLVFREKVGGFPEAPPAWYKPGDPFYRTPTHAAFCEAWKPFRHEYGPIYDSAASTYRAVKEGRFSAPDY